MMFRKDIKVPVNQAMMYLAEYADGSYVTEYEELTAKRKPFDNLNPNNVIRFGITGIGVPLYVESHGGYFHISGRNIQVKYVVGNKEYYLIGHPRFYRNFSYYKTGVAELSMSPKAEMVAWGKPDGEIVSFHFGYDEHILTEDVMFKFKAICNIPFQDKVTMTFELHADQTLDGEFVIIRNGQEVHRESAPIDPEEGGKIEWAVM